MKNNAKKLTQAAMIAGLYAAVTFATFFMSFGAVQYRVSEALTILPVFTASAVPGLSVGCALANLIGFFIGKSKKRWVRYAFAPLPPVIANAAIVGLEICIFFEGSFTWKLFFINAALVGLGELVVCYVLGLLLMYVLERNDLYKKIFK